MGQGAAQGVGSVSRLGGSASQCGRWQIGECGGLERRGRQRLVWVCRYQIAGLRGRVSCCGSGHRVGKPVKGVGQRVSVVGDGLVSGCMSGECQGGAGSGCCQRLRANKSGQMKKANKGTCRKTFRMLVAFYTILVIFALNSNSFLPMKH